MEDRQKFIMRIAAGMTASGSVSDSNRQNFRKAQLVNVFVHHVFFWLKEPENSEARKQFEQGMQALILIPQIQSSHIGTPVASPREVVDGSFTYSYTAFFRNKEDQNEYQIHPVHLKFIEDCQHLWEKVIVYDAMD